MYKTILLCSLLVGGAEAMMTNNSFHDDQYNPQMVVNLGKSPSSIDHDLPEPEYSLWEGHFLCGAKLIEKIKKSDISNDEKKEKKKK